MKQERKDQITRAVISANPDIDPSRIAKIVRLVLKLVFSRGGR